MAAISPANAATFVSGAANTQWSSTNTQWSSTKPSAVSTISCVVESLKPVEVKSKGKYYVEIHAYITCKTTGNAFRLESERLSQYLQKWGEISLGHYGWIQISTTHSRTFLGVSGERWHLGGAFGCKKQVAGGTDYQQQVYANVEYELNGVLKKVRLPTKGSIGSGTAVIACIA